MRSLMALSLGATMLLGIGESSAGAVYEKVGYFQIKGRTLAELDEALSRAGPSLTEGGSRHPGATEVRFAGHVEYERGPRGCGVTKPAVDLYLDITLPRWKPPRRAEPETIVVWETLEKDIRRHEAEHGEIARRWRKKLESALRNLRPERDCRTMEETVGRVTQRFFARHEAEQIEFDRTEGNAVERRLGAAFARALDAYRAERDRPAPAATGAAPST